ncbi:MAG: signal recognition particle-docking protein FtsY [Bacteroidales bacterium]
MQHSDILNKGLEKTRKGLFSRLARAVTGRSRVDDQVLDQLEEALIASDVGVDTTLRIIDRIEERVRRDKYVNTEELNLYLREEIEALLLENKATNQVMPFDFSKKPFVILVVGVNGVGKTTTIGKLAAQLKAAGLKVMLGAADTFRAAAIEQLTIWSERSGAPIVKQAMGSDPAAVAYDSLASAISRDMDVLLIDTAGRLHNKVNLMNELSKIRKVLQKLIPDAPHEVLLVLDGSTGQNAYQQASEFSKATDVTALAVTKLDGTAKGGVVIGISDMLQIPVKFIGLGEGIDDLQVFDKKAFVATLFE